MMKRERVRVTHHIYCVCLLVCVCVLFLCCSYRSADGGITKGTGLALLFRFVYCFFFLLWWRRERDKNQERKQKHLYMRDKPTLIRDLGRPPGL